MNISVIIPTYNRFKFLQRALKSVYSQTHKPSEVIIIDDGSNDETPKIQTSVILNSIQNLGIKTKYIFQKNGGVSSARNLGIKNASSDWIAFLDSDDIWEKSKLQKQVEFHKDNPKILMSYTDEKWIRDDKEIKIPKKFKKYSGDIFERCLSHCIIAPSSVMIHKEILNQVQNDAKVFDESLEVCEDYDLWLRIAYENEIGLVDEKLITKYAGHEDQLSFKYWGMDRFRVRSLEKIVNKIPSQAENDNVSQAENDNTSQAENDNVSQAENDNVSQAENDNVSQAENDNVSQAENDIFSSFRATTRNLIIKTLIKKYDLLLKGAIKHDKIQEIKFYEKKLRELNE